MRTKGVLIAGSIAFMILVALAAVVAVTQRGGGGSDDLASDPSAARGRLSQALAVVPADASSVTYVDRAGAVDAGGVTPIVPGESQADLHAYLQELSNVPLTPLDRYLVVMGTATFSSLDVEWSAQVTGTDGTGTIYRMRDGLDLDTVASALRRAGWKSGVVDRGTHLSIDYVKADSTGLLPGQVPFDMADITLLPDRHLMIAGLGGGLGTAVLHVLSGGESIAGVPGVGGLLAGDPIVAALAVGDGLKCGPAIRNVSREQLQHLQSAAGTSELGRPDVEVITVPADGRDTAMLHFADVDAAKADAAARRTYLADGLLLRTAEPVRQVVWDPRVSTLGQVETVTFTTAGPASYRALDFLYEGPDGPVACND